MPPRTNRPSSGLYYLVAAAVLVVAACFGGVGSEESQGGMAVPDYDLVEQSDSRTIEMPAAGTAVTTTVAFSEAASAEAMVESAPKKATGTDVDAIAPAAYGRDVIYRAWMLVRAPDVSAASREAVAAVQTLGGLVFGQRLSAAPSARAELVFKVPPEQFGSVMDRLSSIGELIDQQITADDVTDQIVDFESRVFAAEASVERLRKFLTEATDIENLAYLEGELLRRETDLATLRGQLRSLEKSVALATITLTIEETPAIVPVAELRVTAWTSEAGDDPCLGDTDITVAPNADLRFCVEVENVGEVPVTDVQFRSATLRIRPGDNTRFDIEQGSVSRVAPGELLVATVGGRVEDGRLAGRVATRGVFVDFEVTAVPLADGGEPVDPAYRYGEVEVIASDDHPVTFNEALGNGTKALITAGRGVAILVATLLPWSPILAAIGAVIWWARRRRRQPPDTTGA